MADTIAKRSEIPREKRWAVEDLYPGDAAWEEDYRRVAGLIEEGKKYQGHLGDSAAVLKEYLDYADGLDRQIEKIYLYAHLNMDVDTTDVTYQTMRMKAQMLAVQAEEENAFAQPEIMAIPEETLAAYRASDPGFSVYDRYFEVLLRRRAHTRSREVEELLAGASEMASAPGDTFTMLNNADLTFPKIIGEDGKETEVTHGRYVGLMESRDRNVRKAAFESMYSVYGQFANTIAANFPPISSRRSSLPKPGGILPPAPCIWRPETFRKKFMTT